MEPIPIEEWRERRKMILENVYKGKGPCLYGDVKRHPGYFFRPTDLILELTATIDSLIWTFKSP